MPLLKLKSHHLLSAIIIALVVHCSTSVSTGGSTDVSCKVSGRIYKPVTDSAASGQPSKIVAAPSVEVFLLPENHNPLLGMGSNHLTTLTDSAGYYTIDSVPAGIYAINANDRCKNLSCFRNTITVPVSENQVVLGVDTIKRPGKLTIKIQDISAVHPTYLFIPGSLFYYTVPDTDIFTIDVVAVMNLNIMCYLSGTSTFVQLNTTDFPINILPDSTTYATLNGSLQLERNKDGEVQTPTRTAPVLFDPSPATNPMRLMQTQSSTNSFTLVWDADPQATAYNLYILRDDNSHQLVDSVREPVYTKSDISQCVWFGEYAQIYRYAATYLVKSLIDGIETGISSTISPILIDSSTIIYSDYTDTFDSLQLSNKFQISYYNNKYFPEDAVNRDNNQVYLRDGILNLDINTTDGMPYLGFMVYNDLDKNITISLKANAFRSNTTHSYTLNFLNGAGFRHNTYTEEFGFFIGNERYSDTEIYEQWTTLSIKLVRSSNKLILSFDDNSYEVYFDASAIRFNKYLPAGFWGCGWYTGHKLKIDELNITYSSN